MPADKFQSCFPYGYCRVTKPSFNSQLNTFITQYLGISFYNNTNLLIILNFIRRRAKKAKKKKIVKHNLTNYLISIKGSKFKKENIPLTAFRALALITGEFSLKLAWNQSYCKNDLELLDKSARK